MALRKGRAEDLEKQLETALAVKSRVETENEKLRRERNTRTHEGDETRARLEATTELLRHYEDTVERLSKALGVVEANRRKGLERLVSVNDFVVKKSQELVGLAGSKTQERLRELSQRVAQ